MYKIMKEHFIFPVKLFLKRWTQFNPRNIFNNLLNLSIIVSGDDSTPVGEANGKCHNFLTFDIKWFSFILEYFLSLGPSIPHITIKIPNSCVFHIFYITTSVINPNEQSCPCFSPSETSPLVPSLPGRVSGAK